MCVVVSLSVCHRGDLHGRWQTFPRAKGCKSICAKKRRRLMLTVTVMRPGDVQYRGSRTTTPVTSSWSPKTGNILPGELPAAGIYLIAGLNTRISSCIDLEIFVDGMRLDFQATPVAIPVDGLVPGTLARIDGMVL